MNSTLPSSSSSSTFRFGDYVRLKSDKDGVSTVDTSDYLTVIKSRNVNGQEIVTVGMNVGYGRQLHKFSISSAFVELDEDIRPFGCDKYKIFPGTTITYDEAVAVVLWSNEKQTAIIFESEEVCQIPTSTCSVAKASVVWANTVREGEIVRPIRNWQRVIAIEQSASASVDQNLQAASLVQWSLGIVSQKTRFRGKQGEWGWWYVIRPLSPSLERLEAILLSSEFFMISFY